DSLNEMFDAQSTRVYALANRVPTPVLVVEVAGAAVALAALALHLALHLSTIRRGLASTIVAALLVTVLMAVTFDLDRPTRGLAPLALPDAKVVAAHLANQVSGQHGTPAAQQHPRERQQIVHRRQQPGGAVVEPRRPAPLPVRRVPDHHAVRGRRVGRRQPPD